MAQAIKSETREGWIRVFCPYTRTLRPEEIAELSDEQREKAEAGDEGVWLEVECPRDKCLSGTTELTIPVRGVERKKGEGLWHKIFCPEDRCYKQSPIEFP